MVSKDFRCDSCGKDFEERVNIKEPNPKCPYCGGEAHWLPKLNENGHQISYALRVICDGFSNKVSKQRVV